MQISAFEIGKGELAAQPEPGYHDCIVVKIKEP
jgi:hypothetical protein